MIKILGYHCRDCGIEINETTSFRSYLKTKNHICKQCDSKKKQISNKKLYDNNKDSSKYKQTKSETGKKFRTNQKQKIINAYGGKCICCGETNKEFLTIDHINGKGRQHRRELGGSSFLYKYIIDNNFPTEFRLLCMNCNFAIGMYGYCPHQPKALYTRKTI